MSAVYLSYLGAMVVWGWIEYVFLIGIITGPNISNCPKNVSNGERFIRAWGTLAYHEIALLSALGIIVYLGWSGENLFGVWTFVILYFARICAKLNLFFAIKCIGSGGMTFLRALFSAWLSSWTSISPLRSTSRYLMISYKGWQYAEVG